MRRLDVLTSLRFIAAFGVLLAHYETHLGLSGELFRLVTRGRSTVAFFFVLSGFILTYTYGSRFETKLDRVTILSYFRARFARIYPMHIVGLLLMTVVVLGLFFGFPNAREAAGVDLSPTRMFLSWISNVLLVQSYIPAAGFRNFWNSPSWSLATEAAFYATFPFVAFYAIRKLTTLRAALTFGALAMVAEVALRMVAYRAAQGHSAQFVQFIDQFFVFRFGEFLLGCALAKVYQMVGQGWIDRPQLPTIAFWSSGVALGLLALLPSLSQEAYQLIAIPFFGLITITGACVSGVTERVLGNKTLRLLGEASFSLYITHWPFLKLLERLDALGYGIGLAHYVGMMLVSVVLSIFFHLCVENVFRDYLRPGKPQGKKKAEQRAKVVVTQKGAAEKSSAFAVQGAAQE